MQMLSHGVVWPCNYVQLAFNGALKVFPIVG